MASGRGRRLLSLAAVLAAIRFSAIPSLLGRIGLLLAAIGLLRARTVPAWAAALLLVPAVALDSTGGLPLALGIPVLLGPLVVAFGPMARRIAATGRPALHTGR